MRYGQRNPYTELERHKKTLGEIPEETCPRIDKILKLLDTVTKEEINLPEIEVILEELRKDNAKLRELGMEWYKFAEEMAEIASRATDERDEMEKERDDAIDESSKLQDQLNDQ